MLLRIYFRIPGETGERMEYKRFEPTGASGLNVIETEKYKTDYFAFSFLSKLDRRDASLNALIPQVLTRGTKKLPSLFKISLALDDLYASVVSPRVGRIGETQRFGLSCAMLDDRYALDGCKIVTKTLDIASDIITDPKTVAGCFDPESVESEKSNLCERIASEINNKNRYAVARCREEMCKNEPFGIRSIGDIESVVKITPEALWEQYQKVLGTCRVEATFIGRFTDDVRERIFELLRRFDANIPFSCPVSAHVTGNEIRRVNEPLPVRQAKLSVGYNTGINLHDPDYYKFTVFNSVFGASPVSKLFRNVREKMSLAYYCSSIPEALKGIMIVSSGIAAANAEKVEREIDEQLDAVSRGDVTDQELEFAKAAVINDYRELEDSPSAIESWYTSRLAAGRSDSPAEAAENVATVTKEDVVRIAQRIKKDTVYYLEPTLAEGGEEDDE